MRQKFGLLSWIIGCLLLLALPLQALAAPDFPAPLGLISDYAEVIELGDRIEIQRIAEMLWQSNGVELAIVTVTDTSPYDTDTYAFRLFREWGIGDAKTDNGLLVLLNLGEREIRIEVGRGLEGYISDAKAGRILDAAGPELSADRFGAGLLIISQELAAAVQEVPGEGKPLGEGLAEMSPIAIGLLSYLGLILFAALFKKQDLVLLLLRLPLMLLSSGGGRGGRGGGSGGGFGGYSGGRSSGGGARRKF